MLENIKKLDPVSLEIYWNRFISICDQGAANLERSAFSTIIRESNDYTVVLLDEKGNSLAENRGTVGAFAGCLPRTAKKIIEIFPLESWSPGDIVITNDPWIGTGHRPDVTLISPIFFKTKLIGFTGNIGHWADIGGSIFSADTRSVFEEGIGLPPMKIADKGKLDKKLVELIKYNVRLPDMVLGDLFAQISTIEICCELVIKFVKQSGFTDLSLLSKAIMHRAEKAMQAAILQVPNGKYNSAVTLDGYDYPLKINCTIDVTDSKITVDYSGTSEEITQGSTNVVLTYAIAWTCYTLKCILDPYTLRNEGSYKPIYTKAPLGSILNCRYPSPVNARHLMGRCISSAVMMALAQVLPNKVIAECGSTPDLTAVFEGIDKNENPFSFVMMASGGMGASSEADGLTCTPFPQNISPASIEIMEAITPLIVWEREIRIDSGGDGKYRGGCGQEIIVENLSNMPVNLSLIAERTKIPAKGLFGGDSGDPIAIINLDKNQFLPTKGRVKLMPNEIVKMSHGGGGGYGSSRNRDRNQILIDLKNELISDETAKNVYRFDII